MDTFELYRRLPDKQHCTACGACVQVCPQNCLQIYSGNLDIDVNKCILCGAYTKKCPIINLDKIEFRRPQTAFASWSLDSGERTSSASGGLASVFYRFAAENNWKFCGAAYDQDLLRIIFSRGYL